MIHLADIAWTLLAIAMLASLVWGVGWGLDEEEQQVRAGKKLPGTTIFPVLNYDQTGKR